MFPIFSHHGNAQLRSHLTLFREQIIANDGKNIVKKEFLHTAARNIDFFQPLWISSWKFFKTYSLSYHMKSGWWDGSVGKGTYFTCPMIWVQSLDPWWKKITIWPPNGSHGTIKSHKHTCIWTHMHKNK